LLGLLLLGLLLLLLLLSMLLRLLLLLLLLRLLLGMLLRSLLFLIPTVLSALLLLRERRSVESEKKKQNSRTNKSGSFARCTFITVCLVLVILAHDLSPFDPSAGTIEFPTQNL
jgi:membrane protein implicated in regulation of membrane protease activity